ncbi:MAG: hypothetical protein KAT37_00550 [Candidatus Aenigmarchaeota archaeon]|nr:hypothetical protein [Candidatus Aenigmarchaeota archaeon]
MISDPLVLGDFITSVIIILSCVINWKIFRMYYKGKVKPKGRYYFVWGLLLLAIFHEGLESYAGLSGNVQLMVPNTSTYMVYVLLKSIGPIVMFYASLLMYKEAKKYLGA